LSKESRARADVLSGSAKLERFANQPEPGSLSVPSGSCLEPAAEPEEEATVVDAHLRDDGLL